jgi:DNA replication ATP-dependent helicase Dna2
MLVRSSSDFTPSLLWGNLLHSVMEKSLADGNWDDDELNRRANDVVSASMGELIRVGVDVPQARRELKIRARGLRAFADRYISDTPKVVSLSVASNKNAYEVVGRCHPVFYSLGSP